ncbi:hypothetical protein RvVAR031_00730 [Agrobacterium vitis]|nr:hypothetical protein RvVAR031_00730 [Agrobacterium vitis]
MAITTISALPWMLEGGRMGPVGRTCISTRLCALALSCVGVLASGGLLAGGGVMGIFFGGCGADF